MYTFRGNAKLEALVARFSETGKVTALVCHATCLLLDTRLFDWGFVIIALLRVPTPAARSATYAPTRADSG
jgi:putative intracellular protease/amidase